MIWIFGTGWQVESAFHRTPGEVKKSVYVRIATAARAGKGIQLSVEDCRYLGGTIR